MSVLDLALRFNSRPSNEVSSDGDETVPSGTSLGQNLVGDKPLNERRKQPDSRAWDSWDTPYTVPAGTVEYRCSVCRQLARFGYGVRLLHGEEGRWFCAAHRPTELGSV
jgi:hypothetical protein